MIRKQTPRRSVVCFLIIVYFLPRGFVGLLTDARGWTRSRASLA